MGKCITGDVVRPPNSKDKDKYVPLTHLERWIPWMFGILYVALGLYALLAPVDHKPQLQPAPTQHVISADPERH
jgi:hypothetical protein